MKNDKELIDSEKYERSLSYWIMGFNYLKTSEAIFKKVVSGKNLHIVVGEMKDFSWEEYDKKTEFSDFNIIIPTLFNFYHGLELVLKGFLLLNNEVESNHKIEKLYLDFKVKFSDQEKIFSILDKYMNKEKIIEPLKSFFYENDITANMFYEALRYPFNKSLNGKYKHIKLKYNGQEGLSFFEETVKNIGKLKPMLVTLGRKFEN